MFWTRVLEVLVAVFGTHEQKLQAQFNAFSRRANSALCNADELAERYSDCFVLTEHSADGSVTTTIIDGSNHSTINSFVRS